MSDDPPFPPAGLKDDEPPPITFPELLFWLRDRYTWREYTLQGQPVPDKFGRSGYSQRMLADCLKKHGFSRCDKTRVQRMERGKDWPGKSDPKEKLPFLQAALHCLALQRNAFLRAVLWASLFLQSGAPGFPPDMMEEVFEVLRKRWGGDQP